MYTSDAFPCFISLTLNLFLKYVCSEEVYSHGRRVMDYSLQTHISKSLWWAPLRHKRDVASSDDGAVIICPRRESQESCACYKGLDAQKDSPKCCGTFLNSQDKNNTWALDLANFAFDNVTTDVLDDLTSVMTSVVTSYCYNNSCDQDGLSEVTYNVIMVALEPLIGTDNNQHYLRVVFVTHVIDLWTSQPATVMSASVMTQALADLQTVLGYNVTMADTGSAWSCDHSAGKKGFTRTELAGIVIGGIWLAGLVLAYCCSIKKAIVQRKTIKRRIKERRLARLERLKDENNDAAPLTAQDEDGESPSVVIVTTVPGNNNLIKVKATVHTDHTRNGDVLMNGTANGHVATGSVPNGHVTTIEVGDEEISKGQGSLEESKGKAVEQGENGPSEHVHNQSSQLTCEGKGHQCSDNISHPNNDLTSTGLKMTSDTITPIPEIPELPEVHTDPKDLQSNGHITNGVILQARRLSRPLKHSMSEQEVSLATAVAKVVNMRKILNKTRRIKSEELVSSIDMMERELGIDNHALT